MGVALLTGRMAPFVFFTVATLVTEVFFHTFLDSFGCATA